MSNVPQKAMVVTLNYVNGLKSPLAVIEDQAVGQHFVKKFMQLYGVQERDAISFYTREKDNFIKRITQEPGLKDCTQVSIFIAFMQVGGWKLSFEQGKQADVYLIPGNRNIAPKNQEPKWIKECVAQPSPYGEKKIRLNNGQLKKVGKAIIVHEGDKYREYLGADGSKKVEWEKTEKTTSIIKGSFIVLTQPDGTLDYVTFSLNDIERWRAASERKNKGKANELYTSNNGQIDEGFLEGKTLTHSFKMYDRIAINSSVPAGFVPDASAQQSIGYDLSEYTEDYEEVTDAPVAAITGGNDLENALKEDEPAPPSVTIKSEDDDDKMFG
jgi:hypothetical protein